MRPVSALLAALLVALPVLADGQPAAETDAPLPAQLTLEEALRIFRARGFDMLLADAQVASANGDLSIAGASPRPIVSGSKVRSRRPRPICARSGCRSRSRARK